MTNPEASIDTIVRRFQGAETGTIQYKAHGTGHIHQTYWVQQDHRQYLLQQVNHTVYPDVEGMMNNVLRVTEHLRHKLNSQSDTTLTTLRVIPTRDGSLCYQDAAGRFWRMFDFVAPSVAYNVTPSAIYAQEAGRAYGQFQAFLLDLPAPTLHEVIPSFHHLGHRLRQFEKVLAEDRVRRAGYVRREIAFVHQRAEELLRLDQLVARDELPVRVTHNDTKLNNLLFDPTTQRVRCVVDLDTVMPGTVLYDFGDAIRTIAGTVAEDTVDLKKVTLSLPYYQAFAQGYLSAAHFLTPIEIAHLPLSARYMTFIMGLRMLTDYLAGDVYYKIDHPEHNVQRTRVQFQLVRRMEEQFDRMNEIVQRLVGR